MSTYRQTIKNGLGILDRRARRRGALVIALTALQSLLDGLGLGVVLAAMRIAIDPGVLSKLPPLEHAIVRLGLTSRDKLTIALFGFAAIFYLAKAAYGVFVSWLTKEFVWGERDRLTERLIARFIRWEYWRLFDISSSILQKNIAAVEQVAKYLLAPVIMFFGELTALIVISATLIIINPILTSGLVLLVIAAAGTAHAARRYTNRSEKDFQKTISEMLAIANEIFCSVRDIKLYDVEENFIQRANAEVARNSDIQKRVTFAIELPRVILETVLVISLCGAMVASVMSGTDVRAFLPFAATLVVATIRMLPAASRLLLALNLIRFGTPALGDICDAFAVALEPEPQGRARSARMPLSTRIAARAVSFHYPGFNQAALSDVELEIPKGEIVGFVGASGSGKSTMATLLLGLLQPTAGAIEVDGKPIGEDTSAWRARVAFVPQDVFLLDDTLRRNIAFGQEDTKVDEAALERALRLAQLQNLVSELPAGLETRIGDRGGRLSGGQKLRVAIARALYFGREVLVLDEATSALDPKTERDITTAIEALRGEITIIVIAHRMSTVERCDRLYLFKAGRVVASGRYANLINISPEFRTLIGAASGLTASIAS